MKKATIKHRLKSRISEKQKIAKTGIENAGTNASLFWQGYKTALEEIEKYLH